MDFTGKALVLRTGRFKEADVWLRLLFPSQGVFTAFAFGGLRSRRRFCGCLEPLNLVLFSVGEGRHGEYLVLREGALLNGFPGIRGNTGRLGLAAHCLRFVEAVMEEGPGEARECFNLLVETLEVLEAGTEGHGGGGGMLPTWFKAAVAFGEGYRPLLTTCGHCGCALENFDTFRFFIQKGQVLCPTCAAEEGGIGGLAVTRGTLGALDWVVTHRPADWAGLSLPPRVAQECRRVIDEFVAVHLGLAWENGSYRNVL